MAKRRNVERSEPSRKETAMTRRERERARQLTLVVSAVVGVALLLLAVALLYQAIILPASAVATVNGEKISTRSLGVESRFSQYQQINQLQYFQQLEQQFGGQGFFTSQIQQITSQLSNNETLANTVMENMIDQTLVEQLAKSNDISVGEAELQARLESFIASQQGFVTAPDATATAEALAAATPTPSPTPSPTPTSTLAITATAVLTPTATPAPTPTAHLQTTDEFNTGLENVLANVSEGAKISENQVRAIYIAALRNEILTEKLQEKLGDQMPLQGEQVHARHILISVAADASDSDREAALNKAISITTRLRNGEDFVTLAQKYSDDTGSATNGGDLGFFGRGQMVAEFEEVAFSQALNQISDPVKSQFGYHIIETLEKTPGTPNFTQWLQDQKAQAKITRSLTAARIPKLTVLVNQATATPASLQATIVVQPSPSAVPATEGTPAP
ncbi:MAG: peptidylprolyl isomerase [Anaerolineae bacterium]